ncbi:MAG: heparan-alpha-glucosaminide N-acetyltransferase domain-containing protein, partial [Bacillota bacterium]
MMRSKKAKRSRMWELDFFRGFAIIMVVWDHLMVDFTLFNPVWRNSGVEWLSLLGEFGWDYLYSDLRLFWRPVFLFIFFTVSGLCTAFSKNNLLRGMKLGLLAVALSVFTYLFSHYSGGDYFILFGVLHCLATIIIIYALFSLVAEGIFKAVKIISKKEISKDLYKIIFSFLCLAISAVLFWVHTEYNASLYATEFQNMYVSYDNEIMGLFFYTRDWQTADYFPLFPYISFFFFGAGLTQFLYGDKKSLMPSLDGKWNKLFTVAGRYSLIIYLSTQIVL